MQSHTRYDKLNLLLHLQHQRSHYKRIIEAKKCIDFKQTDSSTVHPKQSNHKYQNLVEKQRKQNNFKLVNRINQINQSNGILQSMEVEARKKKKKLRNQTTSYGLSRNMEWINTRIQEDNMKFAEKLQEVKPMVGTVSQWKTHFKQFKSHQKRIQKNNSYDPEQHLRKTLSSLSKNKLRQPQIFTEISKQRAKTHASQAGEYTSLKIKELEQKIIADRQKKKYRFKKSKRSKELFKSCDRKDTSQVADNIRRNQSEEFKIKINYILQQNEQKKDEIDLKTYQICARRQNKDDSQQCQVQDL